jgi:hypothetical protein
MSEISEIEIKSMTKEQNYMRGYEDGRADALDKIRAEILYQDWIDRIDKTIEAITALPYWDNINFSLNRRELIELRQIIVTAKESEEIACDPKHKSYYQLTKEAAERMTG